MKVGVRRITALAVLIIFAFFFMYPFYWIIITSIKFPKDCFTLTFIPYLQFTPTLNNWIEQFETSGREILKCLQNSLIIGVGTAALATLLGVFAGYALARFRYVRWSNRDIIVYFLSLRILPPIVVAIPWYIMISRLGLIDTHLAVILAHAAFFLPYAVLVMRDSFRQLPIELEEAALVDGCSIWQTLVRIVLPVSAPALAAIFILIFSFSWNEFLFAFILTSENAVTFPVFIAGSLHAAGVYYWVLSVRQLLAIGPPVVIGVLMQKWIVRGLTLGAVRGAR
jgi:multiple sugar transport system permease protein